jgi:hypothetical protein
MDNQKPWGSEPLEEDLQEQPEPVRKPKYEILREFKVGRMRASRKVLPGDELPKEVSEKAIASLLRKGVLRAL